MEETESGPTLHCRGMRDLLPADMERFRRVEAAFRASCLAWGYQEVRTPAVEHLHLFTTAGTLSPQMLGRVYSFLDWDGWSGERVVLRPDATIPTARLFVEHLSSRQVAKLFYVQNVFRFSEGDEAREYWQGGAELIGEAGRQGDIELILLALAVLERLGISDVEVLLSHAGIPRSVLARTGLDAGEQTLLYDRLLDGDPRVLAEVEQRLPHLAQPLHLLFGLEGGGEAYLRNLGGSLRSLMPELDAPLAELALMCHSLDAVGCTYRVLPALVRNFEYYSGPIFHLLCGGIKVGGGGRYDGLISLIGGKAMPSSGFALELDALINLMPEAKGAPAWPRGVLVRAAEATAAGIGRAFVALRHLHSADLLATMIADEADSTRYRWELIAVPEGSDAWELLDRLHGNRHHLASLDEALALIKGRP